jgi:hypothetical protein
MFLKERIQGISRDTLKVFSPLPQQSITWGFQSSISRDSMIQAIHSPQTNTISPWTKQMIPCNNEDKGSLVRTGTGTMGASGIRQSKLITQRNSFSGPLPASVCNSTFIWYRPLHQSCIDYKYLSSIVYVLNPSPYILPIFLTKPQRLQVSAATWNQFGGTKNTQSIRNKMR